MYTAIGLQLNCYAGIYMEVSWNRPQLVGKTSIPSQGGPRLHFRRSVRPLRLGFVWGFLRALRCTAREDGSYSKKPSTLGFLILGDPS